MHCRSPLRTEIENGNRNFSMQILQICDHILLVEQGLHLLDPLIAARKSEIWGDARALNGNSGHCSEYGNRDAGTNAEEEPGSQNAEDKTARVCSAL
jgi:hypothetical protein